ncbi:hypothetical protein DMP07_02405 [Slackia faecicanis]|uniref:Uncharacterized protein n=1 Tax=Slackia faecicanis TaxID=255723 RepID=A0A3N0AIS7_9ACTN|nr:hypothetical protein DMP07_02405 [Slackia faecicanis]
MGGCFVFVMGGVLALGLAAAMAGLFGFGCVAASVALGIVFAYLRKKHAAEEKSFVWVAVMAVVLFAVGAPLAAFACWLFFMPA